MWPSKPTLEEIPGSQQYPIYHQPGSVTISTVKDLKKLYPNSFDRLGSLKGEYDIKIDPIVPPVQHARRKVSKSKEAIDKELDYLLGEEIIMEQASHVPWVSSAHVQGSPMVTFKSA